MLTHAQLAIVRSFAKYPRDHDATTALVRDYMNQGYPLDFCADHGITLPMMVVRQKNQALIDLMLDSGDCDWLAQSARGETALMMAAGNGMLSPKLAWRCRHILHTLNIQGRDAFDAAAYVSDVRAITLLLNAGADPNLKARKRTPLTAAVQGARNLKHTLAAVEHLISAGAKTPQWSNPIATLATAAFGYCQEYEHLLQALIKSGANINIVNKSAQIIPLNIACSSKQYALTERFLDLGADPNLCDRFGNNALISISSAAQAPLELVRRLVDLTTDINAYNNAGLTALSKALLSAGAGAGTETVARPQTALELISAGADITLVPPVSGGQSAQDWLQIIGSTKLTSIVEAAALDRLARVIKPKATQASLVGDDLLRHTI